MLNPYQTLNLDKAASPEDIERAFKRAAKKTHPDMPNGNAKQFNDAVLSREVLLDPKRRKHFDDTGTIDPTEPANENMPVSLVMNVIVQITAQFAQGQGDDPTTVDLLEHVRRQLQQTLDKAKQQKAAHEKVAATLKKIEKRLKKKKGANPILKLAVAAQAANVERDARKNDPMIEAHEAALKLLDDWEFVVDYTRPPASQYSAGVMRFGFFGS